MKNHKRMESLFQKEMQRPAFRKAYQEEKKAFTLELQIAGILKEEGWSYEDFAKRIGSAKSHVSRDLKGGLKHATVARVERIAKALHMRYLPLLIPEKKANKIVPRIMQLVR